MSRVDFVDRIQSATPAKIVVVTTDILHTRFARDSHQVKTPVLSHRRHCQGWEAHKRHPMHQDLHRKACANQQTMCCRHADVGRTENVMRRGGNIWINGVIQD